MKKAATRAHDDVAGLSFEAALAELEDLVDRLDKGDIDLANAIEAYERGTALRRHCERRLDEARLRVERIAERDDGSVQTEPFDPGSSADRAAGGDAG